MADGQQSNTGQGSLSVGGFTVPLRSRKTGGGEAIQALQGQSQTAQTGSLGLSRTRALTGQSATVSRGTLTPLFLPQSDWAARSAGAYFASRLDSAAAVNGFRVNDGAQVAVQFDSSVRPDAQSNGMALFTHHEWNGVNNGQMLLPWDGVHTFGNGEEFFVSFSFMRGAEAYMPNCMDDVTSGVTSQKFVDIADTFSSHGGGGFTDNAVVLNGGVDGSFLDGYHYNAGGVNSWAQAFTSPCGSGDFRFQNSIDRGASPLTGTNPDTGSAWTTCEQGAARYGPLFLRTVGANNPEYRRGIGDWLSGKARMAPGELITVKVHIQIGTFGSLDSRVRVYISRPTSPAWELIWDKPNIRLGGSLSTGYNALTMNAYFTERTNGARHVASRTNNITGVTIRACGLSTPLGVGTLEYNATTRRFRWKSLGDTYGGAVGFSEANGKLWRNVRSATDRASTTISSTVTLPQSSIPVASTASFPSSGAFLLGGFPVDYTAKTATSFEGCTTKANVRPAGYKIVINSQLGTQYELAQDTTFPTSTLNLVNATAAPNSGSLNLIPKMTAAGSVSYTGKSGNTLTGVTGSGRDFVFNASNLFRCTSENYLVIEVDPASLPTSGTIEDQITIAEYRERSFYRLCDVIVSPNDIPAPFASQTPAVPTWVPSTAWVAQDIPGSRMTDWLIDAGNPAINCPPHGASVLASGDDKATYTHLSDDGGPCYTSKWHEMYIYGGGHSGSSSNILAKWNLAQNTATMEIVAQPTPRDMRNDDYDLFVSSNFTQSPLVSGYHADGKPANCHAFVSSVFLDSVDEFIHVGHQACIAQRGWPQTVGAPRLGSGWRANGYWPDYPADSTFRQAGVAWTNAAGTEVYFCKGNRLRKMDVATKTWVSNVNAVWDASGSSADQNGSGTALVMNVSFPTAGINRWRPFFVNTSTLVSTQVTDVTGYQRPFMPDGTTNRGIRNVRWIPHLNGWIVLVAELGIGSSFGAWELVFFQQTGATTLNATLINATGLPGAGRGAQRCCMMYDTVYRTLIFYPNTLGSLPLFAVKVGDTII